MPRGDGPDAGVARQDRMIATPPGSGSYGDAPQGPPDLRAQQRARKDVIDRIVCHVLGDFLDAVRDGANGPGARHLLPGKRAKWHRTRTPPRARRGTTAIH